MYQTVWGCHSSTTAQTIVTLGTSVIPIVFNTVPPTNPLAGGNFYWVASSAGNLGDAYGHNVYGINNADLDLTEAPGNTRCSNTSCHFSLALSPAVMQIAPSETVVKAGCQGCHYNVFHHTDNGQYRFLNGHSDTDRYVTGIEDNDWEQETVIDHNYYMGSDRLSAPGTLVLAQTHSINGFCSGCHSDFHTKNDITNENPESSPWIRHPTDLLLPDSGEFAPYNPVTGYSTLAPVGWENPAVPDRTQDIIMCLSCHRPHGSPYPDMLRWDYNNCTAGVPDANCGCFVCHTAKDGS